MTQYHSTTVTTGGIESPHGPITLKWMGWSTQPDDLILPGGATVWRPTADGQDGDAALNSLVATLFGIPGVNEPEDGSLAAVAFMIGEPREAADSDPEHPKKRHNTVLLCCPDKSTDREAVAKAALKALTHYFEVRSSIRKPDTLVQLVGHVYEVTTAVSDY